VLRLKKIALPVALLAAASAAVFVPGAFAGSRGATAYDPTHHAAVTSNTIHLLSFRWLVARSQLTVGTPLRVLEGHGVLHELPARWRSCKYSGICPRSTKVHFKLTRTRGCLAREVFGSVYSHLYVRPYGATRWRELPHYHDVVRADCA
jgi:hypothetical protein